MTRVGNEPLLLLFVDQERSCRTPAVPAHCNKSQKDAAKARRRGKDGERPDGRKTRFPVQKNHQPRRVFAGYGGVCIGSVYAFFPAALQDLFNDRGQICFFKFLIFPFFQNAPASVLLDLHHEKSSFARQISPVPALLSVTPHGPALRKVLHGIHHFTAHGHIIDHIDRKHHQDHGQAQGRHGNADKMFSVSQPWPSSRKYPDPRTARISHFEPISASFFRRLEIFTQTTWISASVSQPHT